MRLAALADHLPDQFLTVAVAVSERGIDEVQATLDGRLQGA